MGGDETIIASLVSEGAKLDVQDQDGFTILHVAAAFNRPEVASWIIAQDGGKDIVNTPGLCKSTPLHMAADKGYRSVANVLVEGGAIDSVNANGILGFPNSHWEGLYGNSTNDYQA